MFKYFYTALSLLFFHFSYAYENVILFDVSQPGTGQFEVPEHVYKIKVECWGGGGAGASMSSSGTGGGAGGGAYSMSVLSVTPGELFNYEIGFGGLSNDPNIHGRNSIFGNELVVAEGGRGVESGQSEGGMGGLAVNGVGDVRFNGGNGATGGFGLQAGGGGGGAGSTEDGGHAGSSTSGAGMAGIGGHEGGGNGGTGTSFNQNGESGMEYGGGGAGARRTSGGPFLGGNGASGAIKVSFNVDTISCDPIIENDVINACDSIVWIDGNTYTEDNDSAFFVYENASAEGCDSIVYLNLTIVQVDDSISVYDGMLMAHQENADYQWIDCNSGDSVFGADQQYFSPDYTGNFQVLVENDGCIAISDCIQYEYTSVNTLKFTEHYTLWPNPGSDLINLRLPKGEKHIRIYNILGEIIAEMNTTKIHKVIDLGSLPKGLYLILLNYKGIDDARILMLN